MNYKRFIDITKQNWTDYFEWLQKMRLDGQINHKDKNLDIFFPTILLITKTKEFYIADFIGASRDFEGLTVKGHTETSLNRYLYQFNLTTTQPAIVLGAPFEATDMGFMRDVDLEKISLRFPFVDKTKFSFLSFTAGGEGTMFDFSEQREITHFSRCLLVNTYKSLNRVKDILLMTVAHEDLLASKYEIWLRELLSSDKKLKGVHVCTPEKGFGLALAGQFANTYLTFRLRETTIGMFLDIHKDIIQKAIGTKKFISAPYLPWLESDPANTDEAINPDLMIERDDGFYDVYELKTALLEKQSITKGERKRRRFIDNVNEGIAQLANYNEYFRFERNREYALNKYGIKVNNPNLVLVVGNYDNANKDEIEEASRHQLQNISIVDYDSLLQMFLLSLKYDN
jgi:hypothetical protein